MTVDPIVKAPDDGLKGEAIGLVQSEEEDQSKGDPPSEAPPDPPSEALADTEEVSSLGPDVAAVGQGWGCRQPRWSRCWQGWFRRRAAGLCHRLGAGIATSVPA